MASTSSSVGTGDDSAKKKSVVIVDMPEEFINRDILKKHFEQFGTVVRLACSVSKKYAVIHFNSVEEAENAAANGAKIRPDAPPLKILNRAITGGGLKSTAAAPAPSMPTRLVSRRRIVRTFTNTGSSGSISSFSKDPSLTMKPESSASVSSKDVESVENQPSSSETVPSGPGPLRASIKISRPSPFLKKRPSFGDKSGKLGTSVSKNPFALPPRSLLSLDRRKKTLSTSKSDEKTTSQTIVQTQSSTKDTDAEKTAGSNEKVKEVQEAPCSSSEIILPDEDEINQQSIDVQGGDEEPEAEPFVPDPTDIDYQHQQDSSTNPPEVEASSTLDIDETTEDAILNDDDDDINETGGNQEPVFDRENILTEGETDTQDTAEVSTEEEGEIHDDDDDNEEERDDEGEDDEEQIEENDEGNDDVYESPLKRVEERSAANEQPSSSTSSNAAFSFKLSTAKTSQSRDVGPSASSLFKLPFTSPFALGDAPKPFSSSSFGIQLNTSSLSKPSTIFAGSSSSNTSEASTSKSAKTSAEDKESFKNKNNTSAVKKDTSNELEKPKAFPFGLFSLFSANKPSVSTATATKASSSSISSSDMKPSLFSAPKPPLSITGNQGNASTTTIAQSSKKNLGIGRTPSPVVVATSSSNQSQKDTPNPLLLTFTPDTPEAQELFAKKCNTVEDRYRILEARDKIIRSRIPKTKVNVEQATKLIGTCPDMCPEKERYMRQFQRQLVPYETIPGQDHVVDHQKAIKVYSRSSADQEEPLPHELRPGPTLDFTMHYLLHYIVPLGDNPDENLSDWYNFLWDRTRSIRKDITQQQIIDLTAVSLYEKCARFHIHCASRLCELDVHSFDPKLNDENLMKCLQSLEHLYEDLRRRQVTCPSEPEFRAYQIMMNLNEGDELYKAQQLPSWILNSEQVQIALKLHHSIYTKNFVAFFKTVETLPYMTSCILHRYFFQVRSLALRCFVKAHCTLPKYETAMPMSTLQRMLGYGSSVQSFSYLCETHGIRCDVDENKVILKRKLFYLPEFPSIYRETHLIDSKLQTSVAEAINGGPLPDIDVANRKPHSSFNENGQLIPGDIIGSQDSKSGSFIQMEPSTKTFAKPQISTGTGGFSFGGLFSLPKKEVIQPSKPLHQIESVCQAATSKIIEESIQQDVIKLSQARLEEAKKIREEYAKKKLREELATKLSAEYVERTISQCVDTFVRTQSASCIRKFKKFNEVTESTAAILIDESILINVGLSARTELILAKEYHHRLLRTLERIFLRLRARFALERWVQFTKKKILKREKEEEKRREELWNFPVINSYAMSTKDVFRAFCGNSNVQPSLNKVDSLSTLPETLTAMRIKRKSGNETGIEDNVTVSKLPRMEAELDYHEQNTLSQLWEFPAVNPYSRTNRQVLEALCGSSGNSSLSAPSLSMSAAEKRKADIFYSLAHRSPFKMHRPADQQKADCGLGEEIRHKANETSSDLLKDIQNFLSQVKDEKQQSKSLDPYLESVEKIKEMCPELHEILDSAQRPKDEADSSNQLYSEENVDFMTGVHEDRHYSLLSGAFIEEGNLLHRIHNFVRQVREEKSKSWKTDTFLNEIDMSITL